MKKFILVVLCLILSNMCFAKDYGVIKNKRGLVFQALDNGALGYICPKWATDNSECKQGQFVYFDFNFDFVDNQRFNLPKNYYFFADGIYKYTNKNDDIKTVRRVTIISK